MKNKLFKAFALTMSCASLGLFSCGNEAETTKSAEKVATLATEPKCYPAAASFTNEPVIDLSFFMKDSAAIHLHSAEFDSFYKYGVLNEDLDNASYPVSMAAIAGLHDVATKLAHPAECKNFITGVRMFPGLHTDNKRVIWFYQPILMCNPASTPHGTLNFDVSVAGGIYTYDEKGKSFDSADTSGYVKTYRDSIRIRRGTTFGGFIPGDNWNSDTRSLIFPFQEIFRMYQDYYGNGEEGKWYCENIYFYNCGERQNGPGNQYEIKHTLFISVLSDDNINTQSRSDSSNGKKLMRANLAHLCPPGCNVVAYPIQ